MTTPYEKKCEKHENVENFLNEAGLKFPEMKKEIEKLKGFNNQKMAKAARDAFESGGY